MCVGYTGEAPPGALVCIVYICMVGGELSGGTRTASCGLKKGWPGPPGNIMNGAKPN